MLLPDPIEKIDLQLVDADVIYYPSFLDSEAAQEMFDSLKVTTEWRQDDIRVFGKVYPQPRLTHLFADNGLPYSYSNITMVPTPFPKFLVDVKQEIEKVAGTKFTTCLANLYRNGRDSNGWHADNEKELGKNPVIASLSLGETRVFHLKHRTDKAQKAKIELTHGSLLLMKGETQHHWLHQIPKTKREVAERINLTFRVII